MAHITMREAISQALWEEMERDPTVFILGEEVGVWGGSYAVTRGFYDHFGAERVRDTPIAEAGIIGAAIGAALVGERPVADPHERGVTTADAPDPRAQVAAAPAPVASVPPAPLLPPAPHTLPRMSLNAKLWVD